MDNKVNVFVLGLLIAALVLLFGLSQTEIQSLKKDVKECRADIEELYIRIEK